MSIAIYPGSFDPPTYGHLDIIRRTASVFDSVMVCVMNNGSKSNALFDVEERADLLRQVCAGMENVTIDTYSGLLTDYVQRYEKPVVIRGLRAVTDFEYEFQMTAVNSKLNPEMETMFMVADGKFTFLSSSAVRELAQYGAKLGCFVPPVVEAALRGKFASLDSEEK